MLARLYRAALEHLGLVGLPKVTGKRGIQVWVPIEQRYTFDETRNWVEGLSQAVGAAVPDLVSWEWDNRAAVGAHASTSPRTPSTRRSSHRTRCDP